jgi:hypothetical protein
LTYLAVTIYGRTYGRNLEKNLCIERREIGKEMKLFKLEGGFLKQRK